MILYQGDVWGDLKALASSAGDVVAHPADDFDAILSKGPSSVASAIKQTWRLTGPVGDFVSNNLETFAKTKSGATILDVLATAAATTLSVTPAAPLMSLVWAVPGLLRGDDFSTAWLRATVTRLQQVAKLFGSDLKVDLPPEVTDQMNAAQSLVADNTGVATQFLEDHATDLAAVGLPSSLSDVNFIDLAARLGIREDSAALALVNLRNNPAELADLTAKIAAGFFDDATGKANVSQGTRIASSPFADKLRMSAPAARSVALPASAYAATPFAKLHTLAPLLRSVVAPAPAPAAVAVSAPAAVSSRAPTSAAPMSTAAKVAIGGGVVAGLGALAWLARSRRWL